MSIWLITAIGLIVLGILIGVIIGRWYQNEDYLFNCLGVALGACFVEAVIYGFVKLVPWVLGWSAELIIKICFLAMPAFIVMAFVFIVVGAAISSDTSCWFYIAMIMLLFGIAGGIACAVFAWIPSGAWQTGILIFFAIPFVFILAVLIYLVFDKEQSLNGGYAVSYGDHAEVVGYYSSRREYKEFQKRYKDTYYIDPSF